MHRQLPKDGPNLSSRVEVIKDWNPGVYAKFHFDEPWDGPHNKELIKEIPSFYQAQGEKEGYTERLDCRRGCRLRFGQSASSDRSRRLHAPPFGGSLSQGS